MTWAKKLFENIALARDANALVSAVLEKKEEIYREADLDKRGNKLRTRKARALDELFEVCENNAGFSKEAKKVKE